jgi:hypothetical protein
MTIRIIRSVNYHFLTSPESGKIVILSKFQHTSNVIRFKPNMNAAWNEKELPMHVSNGLMTKTHHLLFSSGP